MSVAIRRDEQDGWSVLSARGDLDLGGAPQMRADVIASLGSGARRLIIDLDAVDVIDSTGLGVLIGALRRTRSIGGDLRLRGLRPHHHELFALVGLDTVFAIDDVFEIDKATDTEAGFERGQGLGPVMCS